jgi:hypothetical protein
MSEEKKTAFKVSDRRKFTVEGETRPDAAPPAHESGQTTSTTARPPEPPPGAPIAELRPEATRPKVPTPEEASATHDAYKDSIADLDRDLHAQYGPEVAKEMEANFGRIVEPFYVTALMQLGMMGQEGPSRQVDIVGARQTIDTISFLHEKMKGNLTPEEENFIQTVMYQVRVAYVDVSNAIARAATQPPTGGDGGSDFNHPLK